MEHTYFHSFGQKVRITKLKTNLIAKISRHYLTKTIIHQSQKPPNPNEKIFHLNKHSPLKLFTLRILSFQRRYHKNKNESNLSIYYCRCC